MPMSTLYPDDVKSLSGTHSMYQGYSLVLARIFFRLPDHKLLLQEYIWQDEDIAPEFPKLKNFLKFWTEKLDGPLHSVEFTHRQLIRENEWRNQKGHFIIH